MGLLKGPSGCGRKGPFTSGEEWLSYFPTSRTSWRQRQTLIVIQGRCQTPRRVSVTCGNVVNSLSINVLRIWGTGKVFRLLILPLRNPDTSTGLVAVKVRQTLDVDAVSGRGRHSEDGPNMRILVTGGAGFIGS